MDLNVNVNVKLSLDSELAAVIKGIFLPRLLDSIVAHSESALAEARKNEEAEKPLRKEKKKKEVPTTPEETPAATSEPAPVENSGPEALASDLPFDSEAEDKPLPFVAIWTPEDARKARKKKMEEIEASVPSDIKDDVHKQMVKVTKLYLNSAAYEHKRDEMGNALNTDGLPVKKLDELNSNETLRFMYLCEAMFYDPGSGKVHPFDNLDAVIEKCHDWEQVERNFVKTYNKK